MFHVYVERFGVTRNFENFGFRGELNKALILVKVNSIMNLTKFILLLMHIWLNLK